MRYAVVIEKAGENFSVDVSDLPACVAAGATLAQSPLTAFACERLTIP